MTTATSVLEFSAPEKCGHCAGGHESRGAVLSGAVDDSSLNARSAEETIQRETLPAQHDKKEMATSGEGRASTEITTGADATWKKASATNSLNQPGSTPPTSNSDNANGPAGLSKGPSWSSSQTHQGVTSSQALETAATKQCSAAPPTTHVRIPHPRINGATIANSEPYIRCLCDGDWQSLLKPRILQLTTHTHECYHCPGEFHGRADELSSRTSICIGKDTKSPWIQRQDIDDTRGASGMQWYPSPREMSRLERERNNDVRWPVTPPRRGCCCKEYGTYLRRLGL
ncbi:uncharacterized protein PV07_08641 [Cladophialophora immunda]|uniref:Uncharacterized protein n=1 Tax=Cladophialophora immunda TaxID=569365 RepID=A0A0D2C4V3_9EURO|nr:uncharacterized protein PV07_08641 [Cladophialophora immunda]KIW25475.1 hypothetical protein PV07_08641 [Cladophialophora immunda]